MNEMNQPDPVSLSEVRKQLRARLTYLERTIAPLESEAAEIREFLGGGNSGSGGGAKRARKASSNGGGRSPADTQAAILSAVRNRPGRSGADYGGDVGITAATALRYLKLLADSGDIRREGVRRGTRWRPS